MAETRPYVRRNWREILSAMPIAEPLVLPAEVNHGTLHHQAQMLGMRFHCRRREDGTLAVWRLE